MSEMETHTGRLSIVSKNTNDTVAFIREHLSDIYEVTNQYGNVKIELTDYGDKMYLDLYFDHKYPEYIVIQVKGEYWLVQFLEHKYYREDEDVCELHQDPSGTTYSFFTQFYNGGACFEEVLEDLMEDLN
jgi:hypothetical protein